MISPTEIENLIILKKHEIEMEKAFLGLTSTQNVQITNETAPESRNKRKQVNFPDGKSICNADVENTDGKTEEKALYDIEEKIPADLDRFIRRYLGLPVMLKAGEYSPNNPLLRCERTTGDVLVGLGEYERRRNTLRKIRQQQYKEYLDQQAKKKQEAKEEAERERREREQLEREREERERRRLEAEAEASPERRRASLNFVPSTPVTYASRVDTGVQVNGVTRPPLSVAVQTDDADTFPLTSSKCELTEAERELSPRTVVECSRGHFALKEADDWKETQCARRRSYGDFDERTSSLVKRSNRDKLVSDLRHTYMPSIFDADAIQLRNIQAQKEAAERRQFYQQELKNQIMEQQRIKEERKTREKMLEQAEMRRLEEQLRMLKVAQEGEVIKQRDITAAIKSHAEHYDATRTELQRGIDQEKQKLRAKSQPTRTTQRLTTPSSDTNSSKLFYYPKVADRSEYTNQFSTNIPESSIFSNNYDVDSYLRRNLNFKEKNLGRSVSVDDFNLAGGVSKNMVEKALVHRPKDFTGKYSPSFNLKPVQVSPNKHDSPNRKESVDYIPRNIASVGSVRNLEHMDKKNNYLEANSKLDKSPKTIKEIKNQYDFVDKIDYDDIDDIIVKDDKYRLPKDKVVANDKDIIVKKRNTNFQVPSDDISDNLDVHVKERNNKHTVTNDRHSFNLNDKYPKSIDKNDKYPKTIDKNDKYPILSDKNNKQPISIDKKDKYPILIDRYPISNDVNDKRPTSIDKKDKLMTDMLPIPVLRHSPKIQSVDENNSNTSEAMKLVEDKWKVPAVQKNILKNVQEDGRNVSILTQLGSIRRQLQLEQLKLDKMLTKDDV